MSKVECDIQWKGTEVCIDLECDCGWFAHYDGGFLYYYKCQLCGQIYEMPTTINPKKITKDKVMGDGLMVTEFTNTLFNKESDD